MSSFRLILASLRYHYRMNVAVALGVLAGAAVLTGALLVGDSVRGSLRHLAFSRLGWIDDALVVDRFFRAELAEGVAHDRSLPAVDKKILPAIVLQGSLSHPDRGTRANRVTLLSREAFDLPPDNAGARLADDEVVLNEPLAEALHAHPGDEVIVRLPTPSDIPRDSALGRKTETITNRRLKIRAVVPAEGMGAFSLLPTQQFPHNAYLTLHALQAALEQPGKANAILAGAESSAIPTAEEDRQLQAALKPTLADYGLTVRETKRGYLNLGSERMLIDPPAVASALEVFADDHPQQVLTYLANTLAVGNKEIPYSTISALDFTADPPLGPFKTTDGKVIEPLKENEIALNDWAAGQLDARIGDEVRIAYFEPESTHGEARERWKTFKLKAIVALEGAAGDPDLTPTLKGVTDQLSISDWNPPFPFDAQRVRPQDEKYWDDHRATPKAFVSLATGKALWSSRFGSVTSIRLAPTKTLDAKTAAERWQLDPIAMGFEFRPVKRLAWQASQGTTPFNALFLGFSFFIIAAALMLVALLFRLGIERRAREIGILVASGFTTHQVGHLLLAEEALVAVAGSILGILGGVGYAWLMLAGLRTWWLAAITTPFLDLYVTPASLVIGLVSSIAVSLLAIVWALWLLRRVSPRQLLAGQTQEAAGMRRSGGGVSRAIGGVGFILAIVCSLTGSRLEGMAQAGAFFGAGMCALTASLALVWNRISRGATGSVVSAGRARLARLAIRNAARNPGRSTLTIGLVASASFLLVAVSAFHLEPPSSLERRDSGTGGYSLLAESDQPILADLNSADGRADLGFSSRDSRTLATAQVYACRLQGGEDASCLNLYQTRQPRVLGIDRAMLERGGFAWSGTAAQNEAERKNPWLLLDRKLPPIKNEHGTHPVVPVVLDEATALYSLHIGLGANYAIDDGQGRKVHLQVVGLLANSILQGMLVIEERQFLRAFPDVSGYRFFLIETAAENRAAVEEVLEKNLGDYGFDAQSTGLRLAGLLAVQNTYLSTFQSLGGLGLLLGTFGLATVQLRNVLERRGELALLRATGFRRRTLAELVLLESAALLIAGLLVGFWTALVAIAPQFEHGAASIPWLTLTGTLGLVLAAGLAASTAAARSVLSAPLLPALRGE